MIGSLAHREQLCLRSGMRLPQESDEDTELRAELCRTPAFRDGQKDDELTHSLSRRDQEVGKSQEEAS